MPWLRVYLIIFARCSFVECAFTEALLLAEPISSYVDVETPASIRVSRSFNGLRKMPLLPLAIPDGDVEELQLDVPEGKPAISFL